MHRFLRKLLLLLGTLGLGALAYGLLRAEEESGPQAEAAGPAPAAPEPPAAPAATDAQCEAVTKSGRRCGREAQPGSRFCWQHGE